MTPKISICIPTCNRAALLRRTINAMLRQTEQGWEMIVGDDASKDDTEGVVRGFADPRIHYFRHDRNVGIYPNWNALVDRARGHYVAIYHDHDWYRSTIVERSAAILDNHPNVSFVHTAIVLSDKAGSPIDVFAGEFEEVTPGRALQTLFASSLSATLCAATTTVRRVAYQQAGPFDPSYGLGCDRKMWFRLAELGDVGYVQEPQAMIVGRSRGDATERFSIEDTLGSYRISQEGLATLYPPDSPERWKAERRLREGVERAFLRAVVKAAVVEGPEQARARLELIRPYCRSTTQALARAVCIRPLGELARLTVGLAYSWTLEKRRRKARAFCSTDACSRELVRLGSPNYKS